MSMKTMTVAQVSRRLKKPRFTITRWIASGKLTAVKVPSRNKAGFTYRVSETAVSRYRRNQAILETDTWWLEERWAIVQQKLDEKFALERAWASLPDRHPLKNAAAELAIAKDKEYETHYRTFREEQRDRDRTARKLRRYRHRPRPRQQAQQPPAPPAHSSIEVGSEANYGEA